MPTPDRVTADEEGVVLACPECDEAGDIYRRHHTNTHIGDPDDDFGCGKCSATFNEPVKRTEKPKGARKQAIERVKEAMGDAETP